MAVPATPAALLGRERQGPTNATTAARARTAGLVICEVDGSEARAEALRDAIARCQHNGATLNMVAVLADATPDTDGGRTWGLVKTPTSNSNGWATQTVVQPQASPSTGSSLW